MSNSHCPEEEKCHHPLFRKSYFKENALSFFESIFLLFLWTLFILTAIRFVHIVFVWDVENMVFLIADSAFNLFFGYNAFNEVVYTGIILISLILLIFLSHLTIDKLKLKFHPKN